MKRLLLVAGPVAALTGVVSMALVFGGPVRVASASCGSSSTAPTDPGGPALPDLTPQQSAVARAIVAQGQADGVPVQGLVVAIATARQESGIAELNYGDRDSIGPFQQRAPWGPADVRLHAASSAHLFFTSDRGPGLTGLLHIPGWTAMPIGLAAQSVQVSAFPTAYAQWENLAVTTVAGILGMTPEQVLASYGQTPGGNGDTGDDSLGGVSCEPGSDPSGWTVGSTEDVTDVKTGQVFQITFPEGEAGASMHYALSALGKPYRQENDDDYLNEDLSTIAWFDCSSLVLWATHKGTGGRLNIGRTTGIQYAGLTPVAENDHRPGDLVFWPGHVGMSLGTINGVPMMVAAPHTGDVVKIQPVYSGSVGWRRPAYAAVSA